MSLKGISYLELWSHFCLAEWNHLCNFGRRLGSNQLKPSSKIFLLTVPRRYFFCESFVLFMSCVCHALESVHSRCCLVVTLLGKGPFGSRL